MSTTVNTRYILISNQEDVTSLIQAVTSLTVDNRVTMVSPAYIFDETYSYLGSVYMYIVQYDPTNESSVIDAINTNSSEYATPVKTWAITGVALN